MFKNSKQYTLFLILAIGFSACTPKARVITIDIGDKIPKKESQTPIKIPVKEEILINNNPNIGNRVTVPKNNPTVGTRVLTANESQITQELNGKFMQRMDFPTDEYSHLKKIGKNTISGNIYLQSSITDQKVVGEKIKLYLNPVTSYSRQWYNQSYLGGYKMSPVDKRIYNYLKYTSSNKNGKFNFFGVPQGDYYLIGKVSCAEQCGFSSKKTIRLVKEISVGSGVTNVKLMKIVPWEDKSIFIQG